MEHNGLLVDANEPDVGDARPPVPEWGRWRRVTLSHPADAGRHAGSAGVNATRRRDDALVVDLRAVRASASNFTGLLQAKTRYAIRRTRMGEASARSG